MTRVPFVFVSGTGSQDARGTATPTTAAPCGGRRRLSASLLTIGLLSVGTLGCATERISRDALVGTEPRKLWDEDDEENASARAPEPLQEDEARLIARSFPAAHLCEQKARALRLRDEANGWTLMEQCVRRADFTDLETLLSLWSKELATAPDAGALVAHVIAQRGGDVENDLRVVRKVRLPLFSLKAALADPSHYRGRLVVFRGKAKTGRGDGNGRALIVRETKVMAESELVRVGRVATSTTDNDVRDYSTGSARRVSAERFSRVDGETAEILHNVSVETGRGLVLRLEGDDPFLEPGTDYVLVVRFERRGASPADLENDEEDGAPVATVVAYFEPEKSLFARLGR